MMNDNESPIRSADLAAEFAALAGLGVLDGEDADALAHCSDCPLGRELQRSSGYQDAAAMMHAAQFDPVDPPPGLKAQILAALPPEIPPEPKGGYFFLGADEGDWTPLPGGKIRLKLLSDEPENGHCLVLIDAAPGAVFFPHAHKGMEEVFLIDGDLETEGRVMGPGDYLRALPGSRHCKAVSRNGCRALMVTARNNHPRRALSAYGTLLRTFRKILPGDGTSGHRG